MIYLSDRGHEVEFIDQIDKRILDADVFYLQRQSNEAWRNQNSVSFNSLDLTREIQKKGVKIVHEIDDSFWDIPGSNPASRVYSTGKPATKIMEQFCRLADLLIVSTDTLAERCTKLNSNIAVCKNAVDDRHVKDLDISGEPKRDGQIRIGWAGTATHLQDFATIAKPLTKIMRQFPQVRIVFIGAAMGQLFPRDLWDRIELVQPSVPDPQQRASNIGPYGDNLAPVKYYDILKSADFDIALAPLEHNTFNRCKSWIKLLEYGLAGIPTIAERFGPYAEYNQCGNILTAYDERQWYTALHSLVCDAAYREALAKANLQHVRQHHTMSIGVEQWEAALSRLELEKAA